MTKKSEQITYISEQDATSVLKEIDGFLMAMGRIQGIVEAQDEEEYYPESGSMQQDLEIDITDLLDSFQETERLLEKLSERLKAIKKVKYVKA
jgi:hypothetical protein